MNADMDFRLKSLLAAPERGPDDAFAERVHRAVLAEQRMIEAARIAWTGFAAEMAAAASVICAFLLLARLAPLHDSGTFIPLFSPAAAGLLILALWVGVFARRWEARL